MKYFLILLSTFVIILYCGNVYAQDSPQLIWLIIDQLGFEEMMKVPTENIDYLQEKGAFGLMNVRTAGHLQSESTYLSIGAGNRCQGSEKTHIAYQYGNGARNPYIEDILKQNLKTNYESTPGYLGDKAVKIGKTIGVIGNADSNLGEKRTVISLAMDTNGLVPWAIISKDILQETKDIWGYSTNWPALEKAFYNLKNQVDALIIETGDITRIADHQGHLTKEEFQLAKIEALKRIDNFIGFLLANINLEKTRIAIIVPTPPVELQRNGELLSWILMAGKGIKKGWLTSISTRRKGIITISDLAPSFVNFLDGRNNGQTQIKIIPEDVNWGNLAAIYQKTNFISLYRPIFVKSFILLQIIVVLLSIINLFYSTGIIEFFSEYLLLALFLIPLNYIIISKLTEYKLVIFFLVLFFLTITEMLVIENNISNKLAKVIIINGILMMVITYDLFTGYHLMADSLLGYSSIIGARYFGLGNEYMGLFVGATILFTSGLLEIMRKRYDLVKRWVILLLGLFYFACAYLIGSAGLGANFGGLITMLFAGGTTLLHIYGRKSIKFAMVLTVIGLVIIFIIIAIDYLELLGPGSHIGRAFSRALRGDWKGIGLIIYRKLSINLKLLRWTIWTRVLLAFLVYLIFIFRYPVPVLKKTMIKYPFLAAGYYGSLAGSIVTMVVNDSGVVAAATILFYPMLSLLYFFIDN